MASGSGEARRGAHSAAVDRLVEATGLLHVPEEAPLVEFVKDLARQMDEGGGTRVQQAYLSALKDVRRVLNVTVGSKVKGSPDVPAVSKVEIPVPEPEHVELDEPTSLAKFKEERGIG